MNLATVDALGCDYIKPVKLQTMMHFSQTGEKERRI